MISELNSSQKVLSKIKFKGINLFKILVLLFLIGMICGAMLIGLNQEEAINKLSLLMQKFITNRIEKPIISTFLSSLFKSIILIVLLFFNGFFSIGQPIAFFCPFFYGLGIGLSAAYLYSSKGILGIVFCLLLIAPSAIVSTVSIILATRESVKFSNKSFKILFPSRFNQNMKGELKKYLIKFLILCFFQVIAALMDSIFTLIFARFLN